MVAIDSPYGQGTELLPRIFIADVCCVYRHSAEYTARALPDRGTWDMYVCIFPST